MLHMLFSNFWVRNLRYNLRVVLEVAKFESSRGLKKGLPVLQHRTTPNHDISELSHDGRNYIIHYQRLRINAEATGTGGNP
jgi:hypothetical protein